MAPLLPKGDLAAAELAFFGVAFVVSIAVNIRHGFGRSSGWLYLVVLSILRIIGAAAVIYSETKNDYTQSLIEVAAITSSIGLAPLLLALSGIIARVNNGMSSRGLNTTIFRVIQLVGVAALVLAIVGGVKVIGGASDPHSSSTKTGQHLMEASYILFLALYIFVAGVTILTSTRRGDMLPGEHTLLYAGLAALPFILVRALFGVLVAFAKPGGTFYIEDVNVYCEAFMQFLMEAITVTIFAIAGLMTPKLKDMVRQDGAQGKDVEILSGPDPGRVRQMEAERGQL